MNANEIQVGGTHYKTSYEHWDFVINCKLGYLEGCATKYIARWRRKDGIKDLQKAEHYILKMIESWSYLKSEHRLHHYFIEQQSELFAKVNELTVDEKYIIAAISMCTTRDSLLGVLNMVQDLIKKVQKTEVIVDPEIGVGRHGALGEKS